ncbi:MAG: HIT family protein [Phycisphaerales bacterium JB060]
MPETTIFDKIIAGEIPCHKVYEDDHVLAFLDVAPLSRGHTLVIPRERAAQMDQLGDESAAALGRVLPRICRAVMKATGATAYNLLQNNGAEAHQAVMHLHVHVIPRYPEVAEGEPGGGLGIGWPAGKLEGGEALAGSIRQAL